MADRGRFIRRFLQEWLLCNPVILPPLFVLTGSFAILLTTAPPSGPSPLGSVAAVGLAALAAAAGAGWRLGLRPAKLLARTRQRLEEEDVGEAGLPLLRLERRLRAHGDAAGANLAATLRQQDARLRRGLAGEGFHLPVELAATAQRVETASRGALERSVRIHDAMGDLHTRDFRERLHRSRTELLAEVAAGVDALGTMLDHAQTRELRQPIADEIPKVTAELDAGLAVAERVEARMASLEASLRPPDADSRV